MAGYFQDKIESDKAITNFLNFRLDKIKIGFLLSGEHNSIP